jgi:HAD superfamily hydrolase (TIGR01549 family)
MIRNIFFDFDGVLAESVNVKTEAFRQLYLPHGKEVAEKVVAHHLANGGVSRYEKVKHYHKEFLGEEIGQEKVMELAQGFANLALRGVIEAHEVKGANEFLQKYSPYYKCWIITGTPTGEIREILETKGWDKYFIGSYGSPEKKKHWTEYLLKKYALKKDETVFIGDALADYEAAMHSGLHFILRINDDNASLFDFYEGFKVKDMSELSSQIELIN